jgi:hypothetical protein
MKKKKKKKKKENGKPTSQNDTKRPWIIRSTQCRNTTRNADPTQLKIFDEE